MRTYTLVFFILALFFNPSNAKQTQPISESLKIDNFLKKIHQWGSEKLGFKDTHLHISGPMVLSGVLCFIASSISSAGGIGGGGLFIPILSIIAGLELKVASSLSAFMVTGGSTANVLCNLCRRSPKFGGKSLIDYDIALASEPCMLLGVSIGVICNLVFPEWLITILFALFLAWSTSKTCRSGMVFWKNESEEKRKNGLGVLEKGISEETKVGIRVKKENERLKSVEEPLLGPKKNTKLKLPWLKLGVLVLVWFSFFFIYLLRGNKYGQSIIPMEPCGMGYWLLSSAQIPLAAIFTAWILCGKESLQDQTLLQQVPKHDRKKCSFLLILEY
ncbi:hypothetical protein L6164_032713 [Bauhinia variegata]|uniref:Uncharacterized protein n=1 Tax=Bauhinia variegata TaxID=167791 RepID=A0ACB9KPX0_BAUVA|nr:hypothetical protein L6164_032713 [Bauhinia variegata]